MFLQRLHKSCRDSAGFTLAEVMTALVVIAIMSAIAVPSFMSFQPGMRLNGGAREVLGKLSWARAQAVEDNSRFVVSFPSSSTMLIYNDANANSSLDTGEWSQTIDIQLNYHDVTIAVSGTTPTFNSRGTAESGTTNITVTNPSGSKTVRVLATGSVRIL